jgi:hypothetical protein
LVVLLDELSSEASNAKIKAPTTHKPVLDSKKSVAIVSYATITAFSSIASDLIFHPIL